MAQYIDKSALVAEIKYHLQFTPEHTNAFIEGEEHAYKTILSFLDTLEVKEVDLEKEVKKWKNEHGVYGMDDLDFIFAKYFFELGLKAQKGE